MRKFRKKPVVIEPEQWDGGWHQKGICSCITSPRPHLHTIHDGQFVELTKGDWIIPEPDGKHFYPCKPDIFEKTYEEVVE